MNIHRQPFLSLLLLICATWLAPAAANDVTGRITGYGILTSSKADVIVQSPETASGSRRVGPMGKIKTTTNKIPAKVGVYFGIHYEITNLPIQNGEIDLIRITTHPRLTNPDGKTSTGSERPLRTVVQDGRIVAEAGYMFDEEWELVPGEWTIEIKLNGKSLCRQKFTVVRE